MSVKSKHSTTKNDKTAKKGKRKKSEDSEDMESSEEELDLTKECHPIGYYMNNRAEMINQMFSVIRGNKLKAMLPPILKDCDLDVLKLQCLDQLLGMSEKRIACILEGEVLDTSSESEVDSNDYDSDEKNKTDSGSSSDGSDESMNKDVQHEADSRSRKAKRKNSSTDNGKAKRASLNDAATPPAAEQGRTLLEILELEMRARAIRALLKQNESGQDGNNVGESKSIESKENGVNDPGCGGEVVDLTGGEDDDFVVTAKKEREKGVVDEKETTFEEKVEKSKVERGNNQERERERARRMQAESELRNKLFKKQICKVKQLRGDNENDNKVPDVKQEPRDEMIVEDPEEGELSSSEDGTGAEAKQGDECATQPEGKSEVKQGAVVDDDINAEEAERKAESVQDDNTGDSKKCVDDENSDSRDCLNIESEDDVLHIDSQDVTTSFADEDASGGDSLAPGETSWRERWLQKDGVQKLVKSSKIYAKVKKRIAAKSQRSKEETTNTPAVKVVEPAPVGVDVIEGSIKEYEKLVGKSVKVSEETSSAQQCNNKSNNGSNAKTKETISEGSPNDSSNIKV